MYLWICAVAVGSVCLVWGYRTIRDGSVVGYFEHATVLNGEQPSKPSAVQNGERSPIPTSVTIRDGLGFVDIAVWGYRTIRDGGLVGYEGCGDWRTFTVFDARRLRVSFNIQDDSVLGILIAPRETSA